MSRFFALANQHIRWQLNDLARRLDERPAAAALPLASEMEGHCYAIALTGCPVSSNNKQWPFYSN